MFLIVFFSIYLLGNFYIFWRLFGLLGLGRGPLLYIIIFAATFSYLAAAYADLIYFNRITRSFCLLSISWLGVGLLMLSSLLVYEVVNLLFKPQPFLAGVAIIGIVFILTIYSIWHTGKLDIKTVDIPASVNMNIVQLSDIHLGSVTEDYLKKVVEKTNELSPDLVLITGDLMDNIAVRHNEPFACLNDLKAPVYYVIGNHERYVGVNKAISLLKNTKVIPLRNQRADFKDIQLVGIDDSHDRYHVDKVIGQIDIKKDKYTILMYHHPEGLEAAADSGVNLMLSGHTHKGQIFPFNFVIKLLHPRMIGLHQYKNTYMFVTSGTGYWGPPMRLGSNCEIVLLKLHK